MLNGRNSLQIDATKWVALNNYERNFTACEADAVIL